MSDAAVCRATDRGTDAGMVWLLVALTAWVLVAVIVAPVVGRMLALDGRQPGYRPARELPRLPLQRALR